MPRPAIAVRRILTAVLLLLALGVAHASEDLLTLELPGLADFELERYGAGGGPLLLWLPSERGFNPSYRTHARKLADLGFEVWLADLHDAYFVERNRRSIGNRKVHHANR